MRYFPRLDPGDTRKADAKRLTFLREYVCARVCFHKQANTETILTKDTHMDTHTKFVLFCFLRIIKIDLNEGIQGV